MKQQTFNLINHQVKNEAIKYIANLPADGKFKITCGDIGTKSDRQRALDWKWDDEIFNSGIGWHDDNVEITHARGKWMFALPIWLRDDPDGMFSSIYKHFIKKNFVNNPKANLEFARDYISTERLTVAQVSEYMTNKQNYWISKGVNLTDPALYGLEYR